VFFLIDAFQNFSNLAIFQGVSLKWHSHNFAIYETLTGAQKCARSPMDVCSQLERRYGQTPLKKPRSTFDFFRRNFRFENPLSTP